MKILKNTIILFLVFFNLSCEKNNPPYESYLKEILDCMNMPRPNDSYNYPVLPGMEKWKSFTSTQDMIDACQIPFTVLKKQSTQAVFQSLWEYPFFWEITYRFNYYQTDFETIFTEVNSYKEFIQRPDAGVTLYSRYTLVNPLCDVYSKGLELFLSQAIFLEQLSLEQKKDIVSYSLKNIILRNDKIGRTSTDVMTYLLISRILYNVGYIPFNESINKELLLFIESSKIYAKTDEEYDDFLNKIFLNGQTFIQ